MKQTKSSVVVIYKQVTYYGSSITKSNYKDFFQPQAMNAMCLFNTINIHSLLDCLTSYIWLGQVSICGVMALVWECEKSASLISNNNK